MWRATVVEETVEGGAIRRGWVLADKGGGTGEKAVGIGLAQTYLQPQRASQLFADKIRISPTVLPTEGGCGVFCTVGGS